MVYSFKKDVIHVASLEDFLEPSPVIQNLLLQQEMYDRIFNGSPALQHLATYLLQLQQVQDLYSYLEQMRSAIIPLAYQDIGVISYSPMLKSLLSVRPVSGWSQLDTKQFITTTKEILDSSPETAIQYSTKTSTNQAWIHIPDKEKFLLRLTSGIELALTMLHDATNLQEIQNLIYFLKFAVFMYALIKSMSTR